MKDKIIMLSLAIAICLSGCGSASRTDVAFNEMAGASAGISENYADSKTLSWGPETASSEADIVKTAAMIAKTAYINVNVANLEAFHENITKKVDEYGGYFENAEIQNYESEYQENRYSSYSIRIPADNLDKFMETVEGVSNITQKSVSSEDVSLDYVDTKAHISALETERDNLLRLQKDTGNVSDLIEIEDRLSSVQAELDSYNGRKRLLEGRVEYSAVNLRAKEERNIEHPIRKAFSVNFKEKMIDGMETSVQVFVGIITSIPVIIIIAAFGILFIWFLKKVWKKVFKKDGRVKYLLMPVEIDDN